MEIDITLGAISQYRCHKTPIDVENCVKSALNSNHRKQILRWLLIEERACRKTDLGGGDYYLRNSGLPPSPDWTPPVFSIISKW